MGGGVKGSVARFSAYRQQKMIAKPLTQTGKDFDIPLDIRYINTKIVNEKEWAKLQNLENAAAYWDEKKQTIVIRRTYFTRLDRGVLTHEYLHTQAGPKKYNTSLGRILEEGTVEHLKQYTLEKNFKTRSKKFSKQYFTYNDETDYVKSIMTIVGEKKFVKYWRNGFVNSKDALAQDLQRKGYVATATIIANYDIAYFYSKNHVYNILQGEIKEKGTFSYGKRLAIENYEKPTE